MSLSAWPGSAPPFLLMVKGFHPIYHWRSRSFWGFNSSFLSWAWRPPPRRRNLKGACLTPNLSPLSLRQQEKSRAVSRRLRDNIVIVHHAGGHAQHRPRTRRQVRTELEDAVGRPGRIQQSHTAAVSAH